MILFILGISITLDIIFGAIIYIFLLKDNTLKNKKKEELDISNLTVQEKIDNNFWG